MEVTVVPLLFAPVVLPLHPPDQAYISCIQISGIHTGNIVTSNGAVADCVTIDNTPSDIGRRSISLVHVNDDSKEK